MTISFTGQTGTSNPFNGIDVGDRSTPTFADIDGDGLIRTSSSGKTTVT